MFSHIFTSVTDFERALTFYTAVMQAQGGVCAGLPGLRAQYHPHYYGAYFRDPDGNKLAVACHADESRL